ncbi:MAG: polysaccharide biosynthesis tyrosine autokinase, partial [Bacteroidota bacterium]
DERMASLEGEFSALPGTQRELLGIERRFKLNDAIYTSLLEKRIQAQITKAAKLPDAKIIEPPIYWGVASPRGTILYALALFGGLGIPAVVIIAIKLIGNRISSKEDIAMITDVNTISSIPYVNNPEESLVMNYPSSPLAESFYMLRSNLVYFLHGKSKAQRTIVVTSSIPGEGKSFTAFNLATSFAFSNSKTVLIEFDLRKPSNIMGGFSSNGLPGVSSYLIDRASLEEITIKTEAPNLDIIQSGQIPPNPMELISGEKTGQMIEELKKIYDVIIIDTPPYGLLTDSFVMMNYADLTLYVTRLGYTKKNILANSMEDLVDKKKVQNLYILVNGEKENKVTYGYGKYPYYNKTKRTGNKQAGKKVLDGVVK